MWVFNELQTEALIYAVWWLAPLSVIDMLHFWKLNIKLSRDKNICSK